MNKTEVLSDVLSAGNYCLWRAGPDAEEPGIDLLLPFEVRDDQMVLYKRVFIYTRDAPAASYFYSHDTHDMMFLPDAPLELLVRVADLLRSDFLVHYDSNPEYSMELFELDQTEVIPDTPVE